MTNNLPRWADAEFSAALPVVREQGEGLKVEFKERLPEQAIKTAKALAAFGTSGGGVLYVGINDNCELVGVEVPSGDLRDELVRRVQDIVSSVRPNLNSRILFAVENGFTVLAVCIPAQDEPVYYCEQRPYIRDLARSRPATPEDVKERVWAHPSSEHRRERERLNLINEHNRQEHERTMQANEQLARLTNNRIYMRTLDPGSRG